MITVNPDLTVRIETETHLCVLPAYHPETLTPWQSEDEARAFAERVSNDPLYMTLKAPAPAKRTVVTPAEYFGLFGPLEEYAIRQAAEGTSDAAKVLSIFLRRLDHPSLASIDLMSPQVQEGLGLLVAMGLITAERKAEISEGVV